jgi:hypothetical protein
MPSPSASVPEKVTANRPPNHGAAKPVVKKPPVVEKSPPTTTAKPEVKKPPASSLFDKRW